MARSSPSSPIGARQLGRALSDALLQMGLLPLQFRFRPVFFLQLLFETQTQVAHPPDDDVHEQQEKGPDHTAAERHPHDGMQRQHQS